MNTLPKSTRLRSLVIPGTHDSNTNTLKTKILKTFAVCQKFTVYEQLVLGIRYLDIRYCMNDEKFIKSLELNQNHLVELLTSAKKDYTRLEQYFKVSEYLITLQAS
jgi:hypothetical protein